MRITPVSGNNVLQQNTGNTGLAPEKLARLKAIAAGQKPEEQTEDPPVTGGAPKIPSIKMTTNRTIHRNPVVEAPPEEAPGTEIHDPDAPTATADVSVPANETVEATQSLSPQQVAIAKARRALQQERQAFQKDKETQAQVVRDEFKAQAQKNALSVLQELGISYDQLTNEILASQSATNPDVQALKAEIKTLKDDVNKTLSDKDAAAEQAVLKEMRRNVDKLAAEGDDYELIRTRKMQPKVMELIERTWKEQQEVLDETEAMALIEAELLEESLSLVKTKKVQGKLTPPAPLQPQSSGVRTLTNKDSARPVLGRKERAIAAMQGTLKR